MPGGRLTREDRELIAAGLTDGQGYAEIARRLARPTSTISREVARNGGVEGYRADHAQRATGQRAKRRAPARPPERQEVADAFGRDPWVVRAFEERFTELMVLTGLNRMAGRVLAALFVADSGRLTAAELVQRLGVSPGSISHAIAYLENVELVRREREGRRREQYVIDRSVWFRAWVANTRINHQWAEIGRDGAKLLGATTPAGGRLNDMGEFFEDLAHELDRFAEAWFAKRGDWTTSGAG